MTDAEKIEKLRGALFTAWQFLKPGPPGREDWTLTAATTVYGFMHRADAVDMIKNVYDETGPE